MIQRRKPLRRTPLKRKFYQIKRTPIKKKFYQLKKRTLSRAQQWKIYGENREVYLAEHPVCECGCGRQAEQIHHKKGKIGKLLYDKKFFMAVADYCHKLIEAKPAWAKKMGYSVSRLKK